MQAVKVSVLILLSVVVNAIDADAVVYQGFSKDRFFKIGHQSQRSPNFACGDSYCTYGTDEAQTKHSKKIQSDSFRFDHLRHAE